MLLTGYSITLFLGAGLLLIAAILAFRQRGQSGATYVALANLTLVIFVAGYAFELTQTELPDIFFWFKVQYIGIAFAPMFLFLYVLSYLRKTAWLSAQNIFLLLTIPLTTIVLAWTNEYHEWIWKDIHLVQYGPLTLAEFDTGFWYWVHTAAIYGSMFSGGFLLFREMLQSTELYRRQIIALITGLVVPALVHIFYILSVALDFDIVPIVWPAYGFIVTSVSTTWGLLNYELLDILPMAHDYIFNEMDDAVLVTDEDLVVADINPAAETLLDWKRSEIIAKHLRLQFQIDETHPMHLVLQKLANGTMQQEFEFNRRYYDLKINALGGISKAGYIFAFRDITDMKENERLLAVVNEELQKKLEHTVVEKESLKGLVIRDALTGVYNRRYLNTAFEQAAERANALNKSFSIAHIDIDNLKNINDTHGYVIGDKVLLQVTQELKSRLEPTTKVIRLGADDFLVILPDTSLDQSFLYIDAFRAVINSNRKLVQGANLQVSFSAGVADFDECDGSLENLLQIADARLNLAKEQGHNIVSKDKLQ